MILTRISTAATALTLALSLHATPALASANSLQFHNGEQAVIHCGVFRLCDIELQPGETLWGKKGSLGKLFDVEVMESGNPLTPHLTLKPKMAGESEDVMVSTDRRMYHILFVSTNEKQTNIVQFSYGDESRAKERETRLAREASEAYRRRHEHRIRKFSNATVSILDQACNSMPQAQWRMDRTPGEFVPRKICQSRDHTYVAMPVGPMQSSDLPVPQLNTSDGDRPVNSQFDERDRVFIIDGAAQNYVLKATRGRKEVRLRIQRDDQPAQTQQQPQAQQGRRRHHHG